jgi:SAM-dependent methyltransferase
MRNHVNPGAAKSQEYYGHARQEVLSHLPGNLDRVLDIGCGQGKAIGWLKDRKSCRWAAGIELDESAAEQARSKLDLVVVGDVESIHLPFEPESFDAVLCLDVLEHMRDPWRLMGRIVAQLKPGGLFLASIPNVRNIHVLLPLVVMGRWQYEDEGILDSSHLRFFTRESVVDLIESSGLQIERMFGSGIQRGSKAHIANLLTLGVLRAFLEVQYVVLARKPGMASQGKTDESASSSLRPWREVRD